MKIKRLAGSTIVVKYSKGWFQGRTPDELFFATEYAQALKSALNLVRAGFKNVEVIQFRDVLHTHSELSAALKHVTAHSTDEEIIKHVYAASHSEQVNMHMLRSGSRIENSLGLQIWAVATEEVA